LERFSAGWPAGGPSRPARDSDSSSPWHSGSGWAGRRTGWLGSGTAGRPGRRARAAAARALPAQSDGSVPHGAGHWPQHPSRAHHRIQCQPSAALHVGPGSGPPAAQPGWRRRRPGLTVRAGAGSGSRRLSVTVTGTGPGSAAATVTPVT
jgi:hypothetical protein